MNPTIARSMVAATEISAESTPNVSPNFTNAPTASASVIAAGSALRNTLVRKWPRIMFLLGSMARKKAGTPMVNILISEIWDGSNGYINMNTSDSRLSSREPTSQLPEMQEREQQVLTLISQPAEPSQDRLVIM